ncbi:hypothetical protein CRUP_015972 [Coryphaenoides rupestris]|nr:hypothetical protein CRUP_015972 [Coryphaenoides rupestris]
MKTAKFLKMECRLANAAREKCLAKRQTRPTWRHLVISVRNIHKTIAKIVKSTWLGNMSREDLGPAAGAGAGPGPGPGTGPDAVKSEVAEEKENQDTSRQQESQADDVRVEVEVEMEVEMEMEMDMDMDMEVEAGKAEVSKAERAGGHDKPSALHRPPYSYMAMIQFAINSRPGRRMTLKEIYTWIEDHFPYFRRQSKPGWKVKMSSTSVFRRSAVSHDSYLVPIQLSTSTSTARASLYLPSCPLQVPLRQTPQRTRAPRIPEAYRTSGPLDKLAGCSVGIPMSSGTASPEKSRRRCQWIRRHERRRVTPAQSHFCRAVKLSGRNAVDQQQRKKLKLNALCALRQGRDWDGIRTPCRETGDCRG